MDPTFPNAGASSVPSRTPRLALASLLLGLLGLVGSVVVLGAALAFVGLALGVIHLRKGVGARAMGWAGVGFSVAAIVLSMGFAVFYAMAVPRMMAGMQNVQRMQNPMLGGYAAWMGKPAPDFEVTTLDGSKLKLSDLRGRRVVLDFWATWCGPCVMEIPHLAKLQREVGSEALSVVGLSREDRAVLKSFADAHNLPYAVASVADADLPEPYEGIRSIPTTFFIDEGGLIRNAVVGYHDFESLKRLAMGSGEAGAPAHR